MQPFLYLLVGLLAGVYGGAFGLGGGAVMVPILVLIFGLSQQQAQGTALAVMMLPVFIPAVFRYYTAGNVKVQIALFMAIGFIIGAWIGANAIQNLPSAQLKKIFGGLMVFIGLKMVFAK